jgi:hypothetical protein
MCQKGTTEHVQERELRPEVFGETSSPFDYVASDRSIIHCCQNTSGAFVGMAACYQRRHGEATDEPLQGTASAPIHGLAPEYQEIRF